MVGTCPCSRGDYFTLGFGPSIGNGPSLRATLTVWFFCFNVCVLHFYQYVYYQSCWYLYIYVCYASEYLFASSCCSLCSRSIRVILKLLSLMSRVLTTSLNARKFSFHKKEKCQMAFLQENHLPDAEHIKLRSSWMQFSYIGACLLH